jgi:4-amino-4-deoxy-L-arabinose transferase-like glycosyltransferase
MNSRGLLTLIVFIAALLRFWNLGAWPVFMDEDIYTWGAHSLQSMGLAEAFRTAYWGKSPFPLYLQGLLGIASGDTLLAGRTLSAVSGCATTALCFFLGRRIGDERQGLVAAGLYALSPLAVLHERMALLDAPMTTCLLAGMLCSWESIEKRSWMWTALAFVAGGLAVQFKVPGVAAAAMPWLILLTYDGVTSKRIAIASVTSAGPILSYSALMLSPLGQGLAAQSAELRQSPSWELLGANLCCPSSA